MIRSMTGFGAAAAESEALRAAVTVKSLNHRFLDVSLHVSRRLAALEPEIKGLVQSRLSRGRVEVSVHATLRQQDADYVVACRPLVGALVRTLREIQTEYGLEGGVHASDVARFPGALETIESDVAVAEACRREILDLVARALDSLEEMRRAEGQSLARELERCLGEIEASASRIEAAAESTRAERREALVQRVRGLVAELALEDARVYQEVVRLVDRSDVSEEVQRLRSHVAQARALMASESPSGKPLDFLAQELMREANTIGSKISSAALVQEVVRFKTEIERLREQVQNVE